MNILVSWNFRTPAPVFLMLITTTCAVGPVVYLYRNNQSQLKRMQTT